MMPLAVGWSYTRSSSSYSFNPQHSSRIPGREDRESVDRPRDPTLYTLSPTTLHPTPYTCLNRHSFISLSDEASGVPRSELQGFFADKQPHSGWEDRESVERHEHRDADRRRLLRGPPLGPYSRTMPTPFSLYERSAPVHSVLLFFSVLLLSSLLCYSQALITLKPISLKPSLLLYYSQA